MALRLTIVYTIKIRMPHTCIWGYNSPVVPLPRGGLFLGLISAQMNDQRSGSGCDNLQSTYFW